MAAGADGFDAADFPFQDGLFMFKSFLAGMKFALILLPVAPRLGKSSVGGAGLETGFGTGFCSAGGAALLGLTRLKRGSCFSGSTFFGPGSAFFCSDFGGLGSFLLFGGAIFSMKMRSAAVWRFDSPFSRLP